MTNLASTMVTLMVSNPLAQTVDLSSLRLLSCGGSPLASATVQRAIATFQCPCFISYGKPLNFNVCMSFLRAILSRALVLSLIMMQLTDIHHAAIATMQIRMIGLHMIARSPAHLIGALLMFRSKACRVVHVCGGARQMQACT